MQVQLCLDRFLDKNGISRYELAKRSGILYPVVDRYYKNQVQRYDRYVLSRFCTVLECDITDIIETVK
ncbi:MAG: helix-turn-helix transcriptional regulator [Clostridia bacterium]|nr:helix-turn-helix transcriptional regulator [Clostridia bacterium]